MSRAALDRRLRRDHERRCYEPSGQNGYDCLLLAALDQLEQEAAAVDLSAAELRAIVRIHLEDWRLVVLDDDLADRAASRSDELFRFCDAGADYYDFIHSPLAVGNMTVLLALLGVVSNKLHRRVDAQVRRTPRHAIEPRHCAAIPRSIVAQRARTPL